MGPRWGARQETPPDDLIAHRLRQSREERLLGGKYAICDDDCLYRSAAVLNYAIAQNARASLRMTPSISVTGNRHHREITGPNILTARKNDGPIAPNPTMAPPMLKHDAALYHPSPPCGDLGRFVRFPAIRGTLALYGSFTHVFETARRAGDI